MVDDLSQTSKKLTDLRKAGVQVAIDDFGTGYSSMSYLADLPIDTLKIDKSFVAKLAANSEGEAMIQAILAMARSLGLTVTSEGIETADQLACLRTLGCDSGQGFLIARPLDVTEVEGFLEAQRSDSEQSKAA